MYKPHGIFQAPKNDKQKIWRYMDFTKFVDILNTSSLYFTRADSFEDIFEGSLPIQSVIHRNTTLKKLAERNNTVTPYTPEFWSEYGQEEKKKIAINCWHMNKNESAAMWRLYLKSNEGIVIQSTYQKLKESFESTDIDIRIGVIRYINYEKDYIDFHNMFNAYLHKRKSFEHERELRCVVWDNNENNEVRKNLASKGMKIPVIIHKLIESAFVSPDSPKWITELVEDVIKKYNYNFKVKNSGLNGSPLY